MLLLFLTWKHDDCFIPHLGQHLQSSKTPDLKPEDVDIQSEGRCIYLVSSLQMQGLFLGEIVRDLLIFCQKSH